MNDAIRQSVQDILTACQPKEIILYAEKRTMSTGKLKAFSLCVIVPEGTDCRSCAPKLHLALSADVPVSLSVYYHGRMGRPDRGPNLIRGMDRPERPGDLWPGDVKARPTATSTTNAGQSAV